MPSQIKQNLVNFWPRIVRKKGCVNLDSKPDILKKQFNKDVERLDQVGLKARGKTRNQGGF